MARLRSNEWNFSSNAAAKITEVLGTSTFQQSPLGHAEAELTEYMGNKRLDLVIFDRQAPQTPLITAELKVPWDALGRTPHNSKVVGDAHSKAANCGAKYFMTWNIRRAVLWRTDDPGVPLLQRVIFDKEIIPTPLASAKDLSRADFQTSWRRAIEELVFALHQIFVGSPQPAYLPLDRQFIARLESLLDFPIWYTATAIRSGIASDTRFRRRVEAWMRDRQGWVVSTATLNENIDRASRFSCYVLVNRLCFYNALRRKYNQLERLAIHNKITTGTALKKKLTDAFNKAMHYTGDYDTVFELDVGDEFPFLSDDSVKEWRSLIKSLDAYDFATIDLEVIGAMYEQLISPEERHRYGQHYTQPAVVDLVNAFSINTGDANILDPACGGGTFLVRAYSRKRHLDPTQDHTALLSTTYGCDILPYACHLSVINLAVRDLIDDENYPRIHVGDFLDTRPGSVFAELPVRIIAGGLPISTRKLELKSGMFNAVVGNPPYIQARQIPEDMRQRYLNLVRNEWPQYSWSNNSDILVWFFTHSTQFLRVDGYLSLLTQAAWLDVEYGIPLQHWILDNFRIIAILESEVEAWFSDARVATVVTVLAREQDAKCRSTNLVRFVQFRQPLSRSESGDKEGTRQLIAETLKKTILSHSSDTIGPQFRLRVVPQADLMRRGMADDKYVGSKWGRYLRAFDTIYELQRIHPEVFCTLETLAHVTRGVTTNCDDFFIVTDVTQEVLNRETNPTEFKAAFGVRRADVATGHYKIIRRDDGVELPLEARHLVPTLRTARNVNARCTSSMDNDAYAVKIADARSDLSHTTEAYIAAGEREHWHEKTSFHGRSDWYVLRDSQNAPILFPKTIQYIPQLLWNDAALIANQRLYNIQPYTGVDAELLGAVLNSTVFAAERFAGVKALGREAANDVEVFTARQFKVPDVRQYSGDEQARLRHAFRRLRQREVKSLLEGRLVDAGLAEARIYVEQTPITDAVWPDELRDPDRQEIDMIILSAMGLSVQRAHAIKQDIYNEIVAFTRKARLLELEAQINRRGQSGEGPGIPQLADDLWADLLANNQACVRAIPDDFIAPGVSLTTFILPPGRVEVEDERLFQTHGLRFGKGTIIRFESKHQRDLALLLAEHRVRGSVGLPRDPETCRVVAEAISAYLADLIPKLEASVAEITENKSLQEKIFIDATKRLLPHRR